ncbi:hypothetical protein Tco_0604642 [Tanacetum coccineum]
MRLRRKSLQMKSAKEPSDVPALLIECQHVAVLSLVRLTKKIERAFLAWLVKSSFWPYLAGDDDVELTVEKDWAFRRAARWCGGDDVKSAWPLWAGPHTCYNGNYNGKQGCKAKRIQKDCFSSDCSLQLENMKLESLVIADQHAAMNMYPGPVHTAHHTLGIGRSRNKVAVGEPVAGLNPSRWKFPSRNQDKPGTTVRRENTRSYSDLDMWNCLAPYVLRLFGRHGPSPRTGQTQQSDDPGADSPPARGGGKRQPSQGTSRPIGNTGETWEGNPIGSQRIHTPGVYGMAPPTELFPSDVDYVKFFMDSFTHPLFKKMTYLESNFIIGTLLTAYENFYPFNQIDIPVLEVGIPSQATTSASLTTIPDIGSSSQASTSASSSQMTIPEIGSTSEASSSIAPRLSENQRSIIKLAVMMSIFVASGVLMVYTTKIDKSIGILIESIDEVYRELVSLEYDAIPLEYQPVSPFKFDSHQQLVLSGFYTLSPFVIRFLNAEGVYKFRRHTELLLFSIVNDPYGDIDSQAFMVSSAASKDELVLLGLGRMFYQFTHGYNPLYGCSIYNLDKIDLNRVLYTAKVNRVYRLRITSLILGHAFSRSRILDIVNLYVDKDSISYRLVRQFLNNPCIDEHNNKCVLNYIPDLGGVTKAFEELVVNEIFEKTFLKKFPGVFYSRYLEEVIIYSTTLDEITFNESTGYALLKELRLTGEIVSIGPGDTPLMFYMDLCTDSTTAPYRDWIQCFQKHSKPSRHAVLKKEG